MDEREVFPLEAAAVATQAVDDGVARRKLTHDEVRAIADEDIRESQEMIQHLMSEGFIKEPPIEMLQEALETAIEKVRAEG